MTMMNGEFCWYELQTTDAEAAEAFYREVVGWTAQPAGPQHGDYRVLEAGARGIGGLMRLPENACEAGARPGWIGYVAVDDVDAAVRRAEQNGGAVYRAADDIPGIGRFAVIADPQGAALVLFKPLDGPAPPPVPNDAAGQAGWRELHADDTEKVFPFYEKMFGWKKTSTFDMGPMGTYQLFASGSEQPGGMMTRSAQCAPMSHWLYYFNVPGIDAAIARLEKAGGAVLSGPHEVPTGDWVLQAKDPQGAMFALSAPKR